MEKMWLIIFGMFVILILTIFFGVFQKFSSMDNICAVNGFEKYSQSNDDYFCIGNGKEAKLIVFDFIGNASLISVPVNVEVEK